MHVGFVTSAFFRCKQDNSEVGGEPEVRLGCSIVICLLCPDSQPCGTERPVGPLDQLSEGRRAFEDRALGPARCAADRGFHQYKRHWPTNQMVAAELEACRNRPPLYAAEVEKQVYRPQFYETLSSWSRHSPLC